MTPSWRSAQVVAGLAIAALLSLIVGGCANVFVPKYKVLVDAISAPNQPKQAGKSYRLLAKKAVLTQSQMQIGVVKACVDAALVAQGMFEPPPNVAPDLFIELAFGTDTAGRTDPAGRETFLQLSARDNPERSNERGTGEEIWDVRVAVLGLGGRVESAMPLLSAVAANYVATDTHAETKIEIPQNSPMVGAVREAAIKALEAQAATNRAAAAAAAANATEDPGATATASSATPTAAAPTPIPPPSR